MLAIIGGTGMAQLACLEISHRKIMTTPYGEPSGPLTFGKINDNTVVFLARHGYGHTIPPHQVNYRANLWALHSLNLSRVISVASVGGIRADLTPGTVAIPDQIIDYTHGRKYTYHDVIDKAVTHIDFTEPYCQLTRKRLLDAAERANERVIDGGVYGATQGPRLETAAEVNRLERDGVDMIGMTGMPEAALAKELGLCYGTIAVVANHAAGRKTSAHAISLEDAHAVLEKTMVGVRNILERVVEFDVD
ncbi:5'-methylthioadenosine phosphorylase [Nitrosospira briensis]|uniref:Probable 6-oxopurine nucleoside phosphorylase n=1 Tax=Nitrosospira briensis TaxID=35799 RepID=A0A1I5A624_9PROT|nr:S-methyl-5'-thioinosine phosphorylase [Nitrosospira briensis]SFN57905.1 5'-methylthioadenosine phosphorylase [Nitrosospira briensis]